MTSVTETAWLRFYSAPDPTAPVVVCLPHAGGSASFYRPVADLLEGVAEGWAVQYPARQDRLREPQLGSMAELAAAVAAELAPHAARRPLTLFGHSMGSVVAFEAARLLERAGTPVHHLVASGRAAPSYRLTSHIAIADDAAVVAELTALEGTDSDALADPDLLELALPAIRADYAVIESYQAEEGATVGCPITVLYGNRDRLAPADEVRDWSNHTRAGEAELHEFDGGHFYLVEHALAVAGVLRRCVR